MELTQISAQFCSSYTLHSSLFLHIFCFLKTVHSPFSISSHGLTGDTSPPQRPSRQAWQTVGNQTSAGPPTARRMARMAILPTALPTGRMDITVEQLHILERQVGKRTRRDCGCAALIFFPHTARWLWVNVVGSTVQSLSSRCLNRAYTFDWVLNTSSRQELEDNTVVTEEAWLCVVELLECTGKSYGS